SKARAGVLGAGVEPPGPAVSEDGGAAPVDAVYLDVEEGEFHVLADAVNFVGVDRTEGGDGADCAGLQERGGTAELERFAVGGAMAPHLAAHRIEDGLGEAVVAVRPAEAEVRNREDRDVLPRLDCVVGQSEPFG